MFLSYFIVKLRYEIWHKLKVGTYMINDSTTQSSRETVKENKKKFETYVGRIIRILSEFCFEQRIVVLTTMHVLFYTPNQNLWFLKV